MENIYSKNLKKCKLVKAKPETVKFLVDYSKSLKITKARGIKFEGNLN
jgi:hypothetical protein